MKVYLLLLLLVVPLCSAKKHTIHCYGHDHLMLTNLLMECTSDVEQACFTKANGEKGCIQTPYCSKPEWNCCYTDRCNQ
ncbi:uncharacterized protein LOC141794839 [Halichoeres trimaculatus]|uniref:uncharacterized protein LOC141794839 n=1 Tax=Halichoeres trimaculatus TaxID=147232 RepID=UPI003D9E4490